MNIPQLPYGASELVNTATAKMQALPARYDAEPDAVARLELEIDTLMDVGATLCVAMNMLLGTPFTELHNEIEGAALKVGDRVASARRELRELQAAMAQARSSTKH